MQQDFMQLSDYRFIFMACYHKKLYMKLLYTVFTWKMTLFIERFNDTKEVF